MKIIYRGGITTEEKNTQVLLSVMLECWKDIRGYSSAIWQVISLSFTTIGLVVGLAIGGVHNETPLSSTFLGWLLLLFTAIIAQLTVFILKWFFSAVITRADVIHNLERDLHGYSFEVYIPEIDKKSKKGEFGLGLQMVAEWKNLPHTIGPLFAYISMIVAIALIFIASSLTRNIIEIAFYGIVSAALILNAIRLIHQMFQVGDKYARMVLNTELMKRIEHFKESLKNES